MSRSDPDEVTSQFFPILFFATAHAISVDAVNVDEQRRDLINRIEIKRLQHETKRTDKQLGASARAEGSTTTAEKPGFAELLGFAIEHGAIQKDVNATSNATLNAKRREIEDRFLTPGFRVPVNAVLGNANLTAEQKRDQIAKAILCQVKTDIFDAVRTGAFNIDAASRARVIEKTLPALQTALNTKEAAIRTFEAELEALSYKPVFTFAYTNKRDPDLSDYSIFKFLFQKKSTEDVPILASRLIQTKSSRF